MCRCWAPSPVAASAQPRLQKRARCQPSWNACCCSFPSIGDRPTMWQDGCAETGLCTSGLLVTTLWCQAGARSRADLSLAGSTICMKKRARSRFLAITSQPARYRGQGVLCVAALELEVFRSMHMGVVVLGLFPYCLRYGQNMPARCPAHAAAQICTRRKAAVSLRWPACHSAGVARARNGRHTGSLHP